MKERVAIIGAGPTGLTAAYKLAREGFEVFVLDKSASVGGVTATINYRGVSVDLGPHRFTPHNKKVKDFVFNLLPGQILTKNQQSHIYLWGKFLTYPLSFKDILRNTHPMVLARALTSYITFTLRKPLQKEDIASYQDYMHANFGPFLSEHIFCPIAEKTWGYPTSQLSADLAKRRVAQENLLKTTYNMIFSKKSAMYQEQLTPPKAFYYFKGGFGKLAETLRDAVKNRGGKIILGAEVTNINIENHRCHSITYNKEGETYQLGCDWVIASNPLTQTFAWIKPDLKFPTNQTSIAKLEYLNLILLYLIVGRPRISRDISIFFPDRRLPFGRVFEQKNFDETMVPADRTVLGVEITCPTADPLWHVPDDKLTQLVGRQLEGLGILKQQEVIDHFSIRLRDVYPVYDLSYQKRVDTLLNEIDKINNLITNGRLGLFLYNNTHHSIEMGLLAAEAVISGRGIEKWREDRKVFETYHIIE